MIVFLSGLGIEDVKIDDEWMTYKPNILVPRDSTYPFKCKPYMIKWTNLNGLFEFKIIQHVPKSEIQQFGYEYRFMGIQKFAVINPNICMVILQMGYNANKELEVTIKNALSTESVSYVGINQNICIGMNYPLKVKRNGPIPPIKIIPPSAETLDRFIKWVKVTIGFIQRKIDNHPIPQMLISQNLDEASRLLNRGNPKLYYKDIFNNLNSLIWNSNNRGILIQSEYNELNNRLSEFESEFFRISLK